MPKLTGLKTDENEDPWGNGVFNNPWVTYEALQDEFRLDCNVILSILYSSSPGVTSILYQSNQILYLGFSLIGLLGIMFITQIRRKRNLI